VSPAASQGSARSGGEASVAFQLPGADVQSESWSKRVAPGTRVRWTSWTIDSGEAWLRQSRPQVVYKTGFNPARPGPDKGRRR
jgi:hypothetical protein